MLTILILPILAASKSISTTIVLTRETPWKYVTKFASFPGTSYWELRAKLTKPSDTDSNDSTPLTSIIYLSNKWDDALAQSTCLEKKSISKRHQELKVPINGSFSEPIKGTLIQTRHTSYWYFAVCDCGIRSKTKFTIEVKMTNSDGSEFSAEEHGLEHVYLLIALSFFIAFYKNLKSMLEGFKKVNEVQGSMVGLNAAIGCHFLGVLAEVLHVYVYMQNGRGLILLDMVYQVTEVLSNMIISILLILIASGWTLKYKEFPDPDVYIPITLFITVINVLIVGLGRITDDAYYKFNSYEGVPGLFLIAVRVTMMLWFLYLVNYMKKVSGPRLESFLSRFTALSVFYFLALPIVIISSMIFEAHHRNKFIVATINLTQLLFFIFLSHLFSEKSAFYKLSTLSHSVLPGKSH